MPIETLDIAEPFFTIRIIRDEPAYQVSGKVILLNLSETPIAFRQQSLGHLQSVIVADVELGGLNDAVIVERFADYPDEAALFDQVKKTWPSAFDVRGEARRGARLRADSCSFRRLGAVGLVPTDSDGQMGVGLECPRS